MNVERIQMAAANQTYKKAEKIEAAAKKTFLAFAVSNDGQRRDTPRENPQGGQFEQAADEGEEQAPAEPEQTVAAHPIDVIA